MNEINQQWQQIRDEYLKRIEDELISVHHPRKKEVIEDVALHLDRRFAELAATEQTVEQLQAIVDDMGPVEEYAELLTEAPSKSVPPSEKTSNLLSTVNLLLTILFVTLFIGIVMHLFSENRFMNPRHVRGRVGPDFQTDRELVGRWVSVDFVPEPEDFVPGRQHFHDLYLKEMTFHADGFTDGPWTWTKGTIYNPASGTEARYFIQIIGNDPYLFFEWMSGDVTIRGMKPEYYVLRKEQ